MNAMPFAPREAPASSPYQHAMRPAAALLLVLCCCFFGCSRRANEAGGRHPWTQPGVLRVALNEEPKDLNPLLAGTTPEIFVERLMFEPLVSADPRGNPVPMLAAAVPTPANGGISARRLDDRLSPAARRPLERRRAA